MPEKSIYLSDPPQSLMGVLKNHQGNISIADFQEFAEGIYLYQVIEDGINYEVEIKKDGLKIMDWTCDCSKDQARPYCIHFAKVVHSQVGHLNIESAQSEPVKGNSNVPIPLQDHEERLSLDQFVRSVDSSDFNDFVRFYARKDRRFTHLFKARYAGSLEWFPSEEKYAHVLRSACRHGQNSQGLFSNNGRQHVDEILNEFYLHSDRFFSIRDYNETVAICQAILEVLIPYFRRYREEQIPLELNLDPMFQFLKKLINASAGIQLKESIWDTLKYYFQENLLLYSSFEQIAFDILFDAMNEAEKREQLLNISEDHYRSGRYSDAQTAFHLILLNSFDAEKRRKYLEKAIEDKDQRLTTWMKISLDLGKAEIAEYIASQWLNDPHRKVGKTFLYDILLRAAQIDNDRKNVSKWAFERFKQSLRIDYLKMIEPDLLDEGPDTLNEFIDELGQNPDKKLVYATILRSTGKWSALFTFLEEEKDLLLLAKFDRALFDHDITQTSDLYVSLTNEFLKTHLGRKASEQINDILHHLEQTDHLFTKQRIMDLIRDEFSDRHTLVELLKGS